MTLRTRITVISATAVTAALALAFFGLYVVIERTLIASVDDNLEDIAAEITSIDAVRGGLLSPAGLNAFGPRVGRFGGAGGYVQAILANGDLIGRDGEEVPLTSAALGAATSGGNPFLETVAVDNVRLRVLTVPIRQGGAIQVARPLDEIDASLATLRTRFGLFGLLGVGLAAVMGLTVASRAVRPVEDLTEVAQDVAATTDLSRRIEVSGGDEIARLATTFNEMLAALEQARVAQDQLIADASHELRTPLTSLRTNIEVLADVDKLPESQRRALIDDVVIQLDEFSRLISGLVELARGDLPATSVSVVHLDELVERVVDRARTFAPAEIEIDLVARPSLVSVEAQRVERAVANLIDNAVKYGGSGGRIEVAVADGAVTVRDHGPGIAAEDLDRVFDRFHRAASARSAPGSGLGLSIVRQVVESHGGTVTANNAPGGGAVFGMTLPTVAEHGASV